MTTVVEPAGPLSSRGAAAALDRRVPRAPRARTWFDVVRWALAVGWLVLLAVAVVAGARPASWSDLTAGVRSGEITRVSVAGVLDPERAGVVQEVTWRDGLLLRRAAVQGDAPGVSSSTSMTDPDGALMTVLDRDVAEELRALAPDLAVERESRPTDEGAQFYGFAMPVPAVAVLAWLLGWACWLGVLLHGPAPWRATRWAWFWLGATPVGVPAFLLLAGPTPLVPEPRDAQRRLRGGWAFLLSLVLGSALFGTTGLVG